MDYNRIYEYQELKLKHLKDKSQKLVEHLIQHPMDYQARNASIILNSDIEAKKQELERLNYLAKVQLYRED